jgi:hypothetical protein
MVTEEIYLKKDITDNYCYFFEKRKKVREIFTNLLLSKKSDFFFSFNGVDQIEHVRAHLKNLSAKNEFLSFPLVLIVGCGFDVYFTTFSYNVDFGE